MDRNIYPPGWNNERVQELIAYYDAQTEDEIAADLEKAFEGYTLVELPTDLLPIVRSLIARYDQGATLDSLYELVQLKPALARTE